MLEPRPGHEGYEFVDKIVGGVIPQGFRPAVDKGIQEAMLHGELAGAPVQGVTVRLVDGQYHNVDSSEMAFKIAGSMAFKDAYQKADPMLLEPIMELDVTVPDEAVGAVNGDLNSRRGRLHGMEPLGGMTTIKAEVPMAEVLTYSQSLTSLTGGRGDYAMSFLRYEEVPAHIAQKVIGGRLEGEGGGKRALMPVARPPAVTCAICARSLLVGERTERFSPDGIEYVDVCPLCRERALEAGWYREGGSGLHVRPADPRRGVFAKLFKAAGVARGRCRRGAHAPPPVARGPGRRAGGVAVQRQPAPANGRRPDPQPGHTAGGDPSTGDRTAVVTVCWDISWYQYDVDADESAAGAAGRTRVRSRGARGRADGMERRGRLCGPARAGSCTRVSRVARPGADAAAGVPTIGRAVIYCVVPPELEAELYTRLVEYYEGNPDVTVIVDRRRARGQREAPASTQEGRDVRDRRRARIPGTFPRIDAP